MDTMSQILAKPKPRVLYTEMYFDRPAIHLKSSAVEIACHLCKSELREGIGITAKRIGNSTVFVCSNHGF